MSIQVGDFVKGLPNNGYNITDERMTRGVVVSVGSEKTMRVRVLEHENSEHIGEFFTVNFDKLEIIGHVKAFNRTEVLELLKNGCKKAILDYDLRGANLSHADLSGADLRSADLDFSCLPLWCGGLHWQIDKRQACQLAYHLCSMQCDDAEYIAVRNALLPFANQFHRVGECGELTPIESPKGAAEE